MTPPRLTPTLLAIAALLRQASLDPGPLSTLRVVPLREIVRGIWIAHPRRFVFRIPVRLAPCVAVPKSFRLFANQYDSDSRVDIDQMRRSRAQDMKPNTGFKEHRLAPVFRWGFLDFRISGRHICRFFIIFLSLGIPSCRRGRRLIY